MGKLEIGKCGRKLCYRSREDAQVAAMTRLRDQHRDAESCWFRSYLCPYCKRWHLTKESQRERESESGRGRRLK